jgi:hypothetical protein
VYNSANLTITPLAVLVTAEPKTKNVGETDPALTFVSVPAAGTFLLNGQVISFTGALSRAPGEAVGEYSILQNSLGNSNYIITYVGSLFTIQLATGVEPVNQDILKLKAYPNPFTDRVFFDLDMVSDAKVRLEIYNSNGVKIETVIDEDLNSSQHYKFEYIPDHVSTGMLIYRLVVNDKTTVTGKLIHK